MKKFITALVVAASLMVPTTSYAAYRIGDNYGGSITAFIDQYRALAQAGGEVEFHGLCLSACTLALGILPSEKVCVMNNSIFGFHSATVGGQFSKMGTELAWAMYPEWVKEKLRKRGWDGASDKQQNHPDMIYFPATDFYSPCKSQSVRLNNGS